MHRNLAERGGKRPRTRFNGPPIERRCGLAATARPRSGFARPGRVDPNTAERLAEPPANREQETLPQQALEFISDARVRGFDAGDPPTDRVDPTSIPQRLRDLRLPRLREVARASLGPRRLSLDRRDDPIDGRGVPPASSMLPETIEAGRGDRQSRIRRPSRTDGGGAGRFVVDGDVGGRDRHEQVSAGDGTGFRSLRPSKIDSSTNRPEPNDGGDPVRSPA